MIQKLEELMKEGRRRQINVNTILMQALLEKYNEQYVLQVLSDVRLGRYDKIGNTVLQLMISALENVVGDNDLNADNISEIDILKQENKKLKEALKAIGKIIESVGVSDC